ncbi:hypothetical protein [Streptomyces sp. NPDC085529]|uniref:hypothetical protein n=1 Tax=Streptomyces sp. NPDC085529 TaxID=3365729 RepID=UPI0037D8D9DA
MISTTSHSICSAAAAVQAAQRQAAAAEAAGRAQAQALISTVQATLDEQRRTRAAEQRRQVYVEFLDAAQACQMPLCSPAAGQAAICPAAAPSAVG